MLFNRKTVIGLLSSLSVFLLSGCVDQSAPPANANAETDTASEISLDDTKLIATSFSAVTICDMLDLPLIGIPETANEIPERYKGATNVGGAMSPDYEIIASLNPTDVFAPDTLQEQMQPKFEAVNIDSMFLNLRSVEGLYDSVEILGNKYGQQELSDKIIGDYEKIISDFEAEREGKEPPTVLLLMGFPGSFCEATSTSYIGNLLELAGGINVVDDDSDDFVIWNTEELVKLNPDYIMWTAHAIPDLVGDMFAKEFETNDIWKHFTAVQEGRVIELDASLFHMSANFHWAEGVEFLQELFYGE